MPRPSSRLDLAVVPLGSAAVTSARRLFEHFVQTDLCDAAGRPASRASTVGVGRFVRCRLDLPPGPVLYANQLGGFRVSCPACDGNVVPVFSAALKEAKSGGEGRLRCPSCEVQTAVAGLAFAPPAALGRAAVILATVDHFQIAPEMLSEIEAACGPVRVIAIRVSAG